MRCVILAGSILGFIASGVTQAQVPPRGQTVTERARPELDPLGIRASSFLVFPSLRVSETYTDNVFATESGTRDDFITEISPEIRVQSDWNRHALALNAGLNVGRYAANSKEKFEDFNVGLGGRVDVLRDRYVFGSVAWSKQHEERGSPDDANGDTPTEYTTLVPSIGAYNKWNRFSLRGDVTSHRFTFSNVRRSGGTTVNNHDRDRVDYGISVRAGYEIVPEFEGFLRGKWNTVNYDSAVDDNGFNRDSDGYELVAGTRIDFSGITYGDVFAGYRRQSFDDARLAAISGITYGGAIFWNVTALTTVKGGITRSIEETTLNTSSGSFLTQFRVSVDHELLRNLLLGVSLEYAHNAYKGIAREDDEYRTGIYARYLMHRNLYLTARYGFERRDSNTAGADFDRNVVLLRLETQL